MNQPPRAAHASRLASVGRALRHRNYRLFFGGQFVSLVGTWMQTVAQSWLVYRLTGSTVMLGLVTFCTQVPVLLFASLGGVLADRARRHRILLATQGSSMLLAFVFAGLTLSGHVRVAHVFVLASVLGVVNAFDVPARQSFVIEMVGREDLMNAVALNSSLFNGARVVGPAIAGLLVAAVGEGWCFFINGASFAAVLSGLLAMRGLPPPQAPQTASPLASLVEGFRFVARARPMRAVLLLLCLVSLMGMPYAVLMPVFADRILHAGPRGLGFLMACAGVGALTGALVLAAKRSLRGLGGWVAAAAAAFGASLILFSLSRVFWLSALLLVPVGLAFIVQTAASNTLVQAMVPDALRGRVMAAYTMMFLGAAPFGALFSGALAVRIGPTATVALGGACCMTGAAVFAKKLASLRADARELIDASAEEQLPP